MLEVLNCCSLPVPKKIQAVGHIQSPIFDYSCPSLNLHLRIYQSPFPTSNRQKQGRHQRRLLEVCSSRRTTEHLGLVELFLHGSSALLFVKMTTLGSKMHDDFCEVQKRLPPKFHTAMNDVYITGKTKFMAQFNKCKGLLDKKTDDIVIHALGNAIHRALNLALMLENAMKIQCVLMPSPPVLM
uniref:DNA/RNA-binding protein Alba-like domain-containing protein n=1 Tax=Ditylenchus dipsaci TaxID=166011 RepID=A0A915ETV9_9BILA